MKIFKIILISFVVLIAVLIIAAVVFIKTFDVNRFKPQIISQASKVLNRRVDFEKAKLALSLRQGISLKISNFVIADDPAFAKGDFFAVKDISLAVDVLKYLSKKEVNVPNVFIDSPRVTIIRQKDGSINAQTIAQAGSGKSESIKPAISPAPFALPAVFISYVKLNNGTVTFIDRSFEPPLRLDISDINISLNKISLTEPFPVLVEAAVLSAKRNLKLEAKVQIKLKTNEVAITGLKLTTELSDILLEQIPAVFPMAKGAVLPVSLNGKIIVSAKDLNAGPKGLTSLAANVSLTDGAAEFKEMAVPVRNVEMNMEITQNRILLDRAAFSVGEGTITASGAIDDYLAKQEYSIEVGAQNLKLEDFIAADKAPIKAEGRAFGKMKFSGQGFSPEALKSSLSGEADLSVIKAKLKDINVLRLVLEKISVIPGIVQKIEAGLPENLKQKLTQTDTSLLDIKLPVTIENGSIVIKETALGSDEFTFNGKGQADFDSNYSLEGAFLISQDFSASIVEQVAELQYLLNSDKQIYIPLKISGKAGAPNFNVDAEYITKKLLMNQGTQEILNIIDKALGGKETSPAGQNTTQSGPAEDNKGAIENAVGGILDKMFKK